MALRPGRQRSSATPIIAKGVVYPLQNLRASKSATYGFASKSDTRHKTKGTHSGAFCLGWDSADATRLVQSTSAGSHSRRKPPAPAPSRREPICAKHLKCLQNYDIILLTKCERRLLWVKRQSEKIISGICAHH